MALHYTTTGTEPTIGDPTLTPGGTVVVDHSLTLRVRAWKTGMPPGNVAAATYTLTVASLAIAPGTGTYPTPQTVTVSSATAGAALHYTTDGTLPTEAAALYTGPLAIGTTTTLTVMGRREGWTPTAATVRTYTMRFGTLTAPVVAPAVGTYESGVEVLLTAAPGATIRYTTNGTTPSASSPIYTAALSVASTMTVQAIALHPDYTTSAVASAPYTIVVAAPAFTPGGGTLAAGTPVTVATATPGATIHYTLTGVDPTEADSTLVSGDTLIAGSYTVKAAAWKTGCTPSAVTTATYTVTGATGAGVLAAGADHVLAARPDGVAWGWGRKDAGQLGDGTTTLRVLPGLVAGLTGVTALVGGGTHSLAVRADGAVWAWGANAQGQVGDGTTAPRTRPVVVSGVSGAVAVAAGLSHSVALRADGAVAAWGANTSGQLGDGTTTSRTTPVPVAGLAGVSGVAAGAVSTIAYATDGVVWTWGGNTMGQLGDGTTIGHPTPAAVPGLSGVVAVAAGSYHGLAVRADGTVAAWGWNALGQLGDGTTTTRTSPVAVAGLPAIITVAAGDRHSLALDATGRVWTWGSNLAGQLGDGTTTDEHVPAVVPGLADITAIAAGGFSSYALGADGTVWSWGENAGGQLGDGTAIDRLTPVAIAGPGMAWRVATPVLSLAAGRYSTAPSVTVTCADPAATLHVTTSGLEPTEADPVVVHGGAIAVDVSLTLRVGGWKPGAPPSVVTSAAYELQVIAPVVTPGTGAYDTPQTVSVSSVTPGAAFTYTRDGTEPTATSTPYTGPFMVADTRTVKAVAYKAGWTPSATGYASYWIDEGVVATPTITPAGGPYAHPIVVALATDTPDATIRYTLDGTVPVATSLVYDVPLLVTATTTVSARGFKAGFAPSAAASATFTLDAAGSTATPVIAPAGGRFATRQTVTISGPAGATLRYTTTGTDPTETDPPIESGGTLTVDRALVLKVRAWQAGLAPSAVRRADVLVTGAVAASQWHSLALAADGTVWAWGANSGFQLGDGTAVPRAAPVAVFSGAVAIAAGLRHSLALAADGTVWSWGTNGSGQVGDGTTTNRWVPVPVPGLAGVVAIAAGDAHSLAVTAVGEVWAWGSNAAGQLGDGTTSTRTAPVRVAGFGSATAVAAGPDFSLALDAQGAEGGRVWAWGANAAGQLGDGSTAARLTPVRVLGLDQVRAVGAGTDWAMALTADGRVWTWGANAAGQLGQGTTVASSIPQPVPGLTDVALVAAGGAQALAVTRAGRVFGWGANGYGQLGNGLSSCRGDPCLSPEDLLAVPASLALVGGVNHSLFVTTDGRVVGTGYNANGQLGDGTVTSRLTPVSASGLTLAANAWLTSDIDGDGLTAAQELLFGLDPLRADTNGDGLPDGVDAPAAGTAGHPDLDGDGVANAVELTWGTDPFVADTDGDGIPDGADAFPEDATRWQAPLADPTDHTPPAITLTTPATARPVP